MIFAELKQPHATPVVGIWISPFPMYYMPKLEGFHVRIQTAKVSKDYVIDVIDPPGDGLHEAVRLVGDDGKEHGVVSAKDGTHACTCQSWEHVCAKEGRPCKHIAGLICLGILRRDLIPYMNLEKSA